MEHIGKIVNQNKKYTTVSNDSKVKNNLNTDSNGNNGNSSKEKPYTLNRSTFTPNTEETQLAEEIAFFLNDLTNYAGYLDIVNHIGVHNTRSEFAALKEEIKEKMGGRFEIRNPRAYFNWVCRKKYSKFWKKERQTV